MARTSFAALALVLCALASPARAAEPWPDSCKLQLQASLPFTLAHGHIRIDVALNGVPRHFMVDTGGLLSSVSEDVAGAQNLETHRVSEEIDIEGIGGKRTRRFAVADTLTFGKLKADHVRLLVLPAGLEDGILAPDFLRNFDLDFDFAARTLNLFRPHPCKDHAVYWDGPTAELPMEVTSQGHIRVPVTLDGTELDAMIDTGSPASLIGAGTVATKFDLEFGQGDVTVRGAGGGVTTASEHRFQTLALGGLTINHPPLLVSKDETAWRSDYARLLLGLKELSLFHVYIAYREHRLYLSPLPPG